MAAATEVDDEALGSSVPPVVALGEAVGSILGMLVVGFMVGPMVSIVASSKSI